MPNILQINSTKKDLFKFHPHNLLWLGLSIVAIILDQWTKWIALTKIHHLDLPCQNGI